MSEVWQVFNRDTGIVVAERQTEPEAERARDSINDKWSWPEEPFAATYVLDIRRIATPKDGS